MNRPRVGECGDAIGHRASRIVHSEAALAAEPFSARLVAWQRAHGRHGLPWQGTRDPYRIWISEVMLQQTQVAAALPYYERFVERFPDIRTLAAATIDRVLERWAGLGYYRRAHHLHAAAKAIVDKHGGTFPRDVAAIAALPGIGRSTAAAIAAFAFGAREAILDGNVKRVLARHCGIEGFPGTASVQRQLWDAAESLLPATDIERYTQAMMDLGATVCTRAPACLLCPVSGDCLARIEGRIAELPAPRPGKIVRQLAVRVLILERGGEILFERRPPTGVWSGLWSLPEMPLDEDACHVVRERFGADAISGVALAPMTHTFTHFKLTLHPQRLAVRTWPMRDEAPGCAWLTPADALCAALPAPIKRLVLSLV